MRKHLVFFVSSFLILTSCAQEPHPSKDILDAPLDSTDMGMDQVDEIINPKGETIVTRFQTPSNFTRHKVAKNSYAAYLRELPLKPNGAMVKHYDGTIKYNNNVYDAVVDLEIGKRDLHQCADAVMRIRADYLWKNEKYDQIHFNFTNGFRVDYTEWMKGKRISFKNKKTQWYQKSTPSNSYKDYWKYMELIFSYAGTLSLSRELVPVDLNEMKIGDVFIWGGSPGHAVLVVDMAKNKVTNESIFLLAQSYMPAQEIQILKNPKQSDNPWYAVSDIKQQLFTPEWTFQKDALKRFKE
jgi:hypothetical protein